MGDTVQRQVIEAVQGRRQRYIQFLRQMVAFDSTTIRHGFDGNEKAIQEWLGGVLDDMGFQTRFFEPDNDKIGGYPDFSVGHSYRDRPNLVGTLAGRGGGRSLILNGHVDTMTPGDREKWTHDPFGAEIEDDTMYGLGVCDMKGGLAAAICAVDVLQQLDIPLDGDVIVESVVDEEGGGNGTLACVVEGIRADAAIVAEPTRLHVQPGTRGVMLLSIEVTGRAAHACLKWSGVNAIEKTMRIIDDLRELERLWLARRRHPLYPSPTITVGQIMGGVAGSAVPGECTINVDVKYLPLEIDDRGIGAANTGDAIQEVVETQIQRTCQGDAWLKDHPPRVTRYQHCSPYLLDPEHELVHTVHGAAQAVLGSAQVSGFPAGCDARHFYNIAGIPAVVFGPGDLQFAHSIDEHISVTDYVRAIQVFALTILNWTNCRS